MGEELTYDLYIDELKYIYDSLDYIEKNILRDLENIENNFTKKNEAIIPPNILKKSKEKHKSIKRTIIEGLFIREVSLVEDFFINLSFVIYNEQTKHQRSIIYPPYYDEKYSKKHYTDPKIAINFLKSEFNLDINKQNTWEIYVAMRKIRHRLAHGKTLLKFESKQEINNLNKFGEILAPTDNCSTYLSDNINVHKNIIQKFIQLIEYTQNISYDKYLSNYIPFNKLK